MISVEDVISQSARGGGLGYDNQWEGILQYTISQPQSRGNGRDICKGKREGLIARRFAGPTL